SAIGHDGRATGDVDGAARAADAAARAVAKCAAVAAVTALAAGAADNDAACAVTAGRDRRVGHCERRDRAAAADAARLGTVARVAGAAIAADAGSVLQSDTGSIQRGDGDVAEVGNEPVATGAVITHLRAIGACAQEAARGICTV